MYNGYIESSKGAKQNKTKQNILSSTNTTLI